MENLKTKILAIDDTRDNLVSLKALINESFPETQILTAQNGKKGLELAKTELPDVIILDIIMPEMDGYEVCQRLKEKESTKHIPVLMLTAIKTDVESRVKGLNLGADAFLSKPIDHIELSAQINVMLRIKRAEDKLREEKTNLEDLVFKRTYELKESEEKYKMLFENAPLPYHSLNKDGIFVDVNPAWLEITGYKRDEVIGKWYGDFLHLDYKSHFKEKFPEFKKCGHVQTMFKLKHKKGHYFDILLEGRVGFDKDGLFKQTYCVFQDITQRKLAEEKLKESEEKFKTLVTNNEEIIYMIDKDGEFQLSEGKGLVHLGLKAGEIVGKSIFELYQNQPEVLQAIEKTFQGEVNTQEIKVGNSYFRNRFTPHKNQKGETIGLLGLSINISELKRVEEALGYEQFLLHSFMDNSPDIIYFKDINSRFIRINKAHARLFGLTNPEDAIGKSDSDFFTHDHGNNAYNDEQQIIKTGRAIINKEERETWKDGRITWALTTKLPLRNKEGEIIGTFGVSRDITKLKKANEALKNSEERYKAFINANSDMIFLKDNEARYLVVNDAHAQFFGKTKEEMLGKTDSDLASEDRIYPCHSSDLKALASESAFIVEELLGERHCETIKFPVQLEDNKKGIGGIIRDITMRVKSEKQLKLLGKAIEQNPVTIVITDKAGSIEYVNPKFTKTTGYSLEEVIGKNPRVLQSGKLSSEFYKELWATILSGKDWQGEFHNIKKNGESYWESALISPVFDEKKNISHFIAVKEDITERKKMISDLVFAKEKATESDRLKSAFLATMSHELRTPLNAIIGFSELISEEESANEMVKFAEIINSSGIHLLQIIEDLFDITLIESGKTKICKTETSLQSILENVFEIIKVDQQKLKKNHLKINLVVPADYENLRIFTDSLRLKQILINLLKNALKFTPEGHINFGCHINEEDYSNPVFKFFVEDTGIGVPPEMQEIIFENFRQVDDRMSREFEGTGIGLSISKKLTELLGGKIWIQSNRKNETGDELYQQKDVSGGSTFYFTIPYIRQTKIAWPPAENSINKIDKLKKTILIVEDDEFSYLYLKIILKKMKLDFIRAKNGEKAVFICKRNLNIDVVLMDINMPGINGYEATKKIKLIRPNLPVIAQTAYAIVGDKERALESGCSDYVSKPIDQALFTKLILKYLS